MKGKRTPETCPRCGKRPCASIGGGWTGFACGPCGKAEVEEVRRGMAELEAQNYDAWRRHFVASNNVRNSGEAILTAMDKASAAIAATR